VVRCRRDARRKSNENENLGKKYKNQSDREDFMMSRDFGRLAQIGVFVLAGSIGVLAQPPTHVSFIGLINDRTAASAGSWEVHGDWSLNLNGESGKADFLAVLTMERSDYWVLTTPADPDARTPHTHHIKVDKGTVTPIANGLRVSGMAAITGNGNPAPFGQYSPLKIDITGGTSVAFSNVSLTFEGAAAGHFGSQPLNGAVRNRK
jgi:hypothetical protein